MDVFKEDRILLDEEAEKAIWGMGEFIRTRRSELGITQKYLSKVTGLDTAHISRIERGMRPQVSLPVMVKILSALGAELKITKLY